MKIKSFFILSILLACLVRSAPGADLTNALQTGLFEEEANHNLAAAVQAYQTIIARTDEQRKLAATALFRLAECYRKLGQTNEANVQYQRVLRDFSDQTSLADLSRLNLVAANQALPTAAPKPQSSPELGVITVLGEVQRIGVVEFSKLRQMTLPEAIGRAGGFTKLANNRNIQITRGTNLFKFDFRTYTKNPSTYPVSPNLEDGDVISVPEGGL